MFEPLYIFGLFVTLAWPNLTNTFLIKYQTSSDYELCKDRNHAYLVHCYVLNAWPRTQHGVGTQ